MSRRASFLLAAWFAGTLAVMAVGVSIGASSVPQLHACVQKTTNLMRYTTGTTCKSGEKLLTWNVQGVAGPKGATGAAGAPGPAGATGAQGPAGGSGSSVGVAYYQADLPGGSIQGSGTVGSLKVPAGTYLLDAAFIGTTGVGSCKLSVAGRVATFTDATVISLTCTTTGPVPFSWQGAQIVATVATRLPNVP